MVYLLQRIIRLEMEGKVFKKKELADIKHKLHWGGDRQVDNVLLTRP